MADRNIEALVSPLDIGSASGRTNFATNGKQTLEEDAKVINLMPVLFIGASIQPPGNLVAYDYNENALVFQPSGDVTDPSDRIIAHFILYPNSGQVGNGVALILRFKQTNADNTEFTIQYRIQPDGGGAIVTGWTTLSADVNTNGVYTYTSGSIIQHIKFATISLAGVGNAPTMDIRLARSDAIAGNKSVNVAYMEYTTDKLGI